MNDEAAFLSAIEATPDDDTLRLVFADWLDEHGRREIGRGGMRGDGLGERLDAGRDIRFGEQRNGRRPHFPVPPRRTSRWRTPDGGLESRVRKRTVWPGFSVCTPEEKLH